MLSFNFLGSRRGNALVLPVCCVPSAAHLPPGGGNHPGDPISVSIAVKDIPELTEVLVSRLVASNVSDLDERKNQLEKRLARIRQIGPADNPALAALRLAANEAITDSLDLRSQAFWESEVWESDVRVGLRQGELDQATRHWLIARVLRGVPEDRVPSLLTLEEIEEGLRHPELPDEVRRRWETYVERRRTRA
jgi:hypothetical protein